MNVPAKLPNARSVQMPGKSVTDSSPMTTKARPRNSASVPIVTASDGRPKRVTSTPLKAPHSAPATRQSGMISSTGRPWFHSDAAIALDSASTEATERSISAAMITSASGSAISATSEKSSEPVVNESVVRNSDDRLWPATTVTRMSAISSASQRPANARTRAPDAARAGTGAVASACTARAPPAQGGLDAQAEEAIERDRDQQQRADRGLLPERLDAQDDQRRRDRAEQQRAERGAVDAAGAAEDRDAADHRRGDHGQLVAGAGGRVDGREARREQRPAESGQRAGEHERGQDAAVRAHAGQARALWVRADRVELPPGAEVAQPLPDHDHHDERDDHQVRDAEDRAGADVEEVVGQRLGVDLAPVRPQERQAAERVERPQRHDERRPLAPGGEEAVEQPARRAHQDRQQEHQRQGHARMLGEQVAGQEGGEPDDRADRQVDVARDDHERLADREDREDRRVEREVAQRGGLQEARLEDAGEGDPQRERDDDAELADAEDALDEAAGALALDGCGGGRQAAASSTWPVASRITLSSSASARDSSPVRRPSCMTSTRSAMPSTSGSSLEIIRTATPWPASSLIRRWTSDFVPTSMPRVGSSTMSTFGLVASHFPSTTFCWLPPDSVPTLSPSRWYLSCRRAAHSSASEFSAPLRISPVRASARSRVSDTLRAIERSITSPCWRRSSGTKPSPARMAASGGPRGSCRPATSTRPASALSMPKIARATSLRPAPTSPASATISPARTSKLTSVKTPSRVSRWTLSIVAPASASSLGNSAESSRPTIRRTTSSGVISAVVASWTTSPSRITVTVSQRAKTSSRRCEMKSTAAPWSRSVRTTPKSRSTSGPDRAAVGSSMISTRASKLSALAISTICWSAIDRPRTGRSASSRTPRRSSCAWTLSCIARRSMRRSAPSGWPPITTFSATDRSGNSVGSW